MLTPVIFPVTISKWPPGFPKNVCIQQDNAKPHCKDTDPEIKSSIKAAALLGLTIKLVNQLPNSPDLNVLDLAFFASIQSIQYKIPAKNTDGLVEVVLRAFQTLGVDCCKNVWTTLQMVQNEIIGCKVDNNYKLPHIGKAKYRQENGGRLPL